MYNGVGAYYNVIGQDIKELIQRVTFVTYPTETMTCNELLSNQDLLENHIDYMNSIYPTLKHKKKLSYDKAIRAQTAKLNAYKEKTINCGLDAGMQPGPMATLPGTTPLTPEPIKNGLPSKAPEIGMDIKKYLPLLIGGAALLFILTKRK